MKNEDKEAFEKWFKTSYLKDDLDWVAESAWQDACAYKQKEIDDLKDRLHHEVEMIDGAAKDHIEKLQAENAKLRECVQLIAGHQEFYCEVGDANKQAYARQVLKELE